MSEPSIETETLAERLRASARVESCPRLLNEAADALDQLARMYFKASTNTASEYGNVEKK